MPPIAQQYPTAASLAQQQPPANPTGKPKQPTAKKSEGDYRSAFVTVCFTPGELELLEFRGEGMRADKIEIHLGIGA